MKFKKMHGLGNDFVVIDNREGRYTLSAQDCVKIADRRFGVGCDLVVILERSERADILAIFYNADGSESAACGNATRCVADILMGETGGDACAVETRHGVLPCRRVENGWIEVDMGVPRLEWGDIPLSEARDTLMLELGDKVTNPAVAVNMGNPHCVLFVEDAEHFPVERVGTVVENHPLFPQRTNVEFVHVMEDGRLRQRTWERGCGETLACGSGACAVGVAAVRRGLIDGRRVEILLNGGSLIIEWRESDGHVLMSGPAASVFEGHWPE